MNTDEIFEYFVWKVQNERRHKYKRIKCMKKIIGWIVVRKV